MSAQSELRSPASSDSPILPVPRIAILMAQAYESGVVSRQQVHAREPGPLAVGLEQGVGLLRLDAAPGERGGELDEAEIAGEPALVAAEALRGRRRRPTRGRRRARARAGARRRSVGVPAQRLEVEGAADADERGAAAGAEPEPRELGRREAAEVGCRSGRA